MAREVSRENGWGHRTIAANSEAFRMIGKKKLAAIRAEVAALLGELPGASPKAWFEKQIASAAGDPKRDVQTLKMLCNALEREVKKQQKPKPRRQFTRK